MVTLWAMFGRALSRKIDCGSEPGSRLKLMVKGEHQKSAFDPMIAARKLQNALLVAVSQTPSPGLASGSSPESLTVRVAGHGSVPLPVNWKVYGFSSGSSLAMLTVAVAGATDDGVNFTMKVGVSPTANGEAG